MGCFFNCLKPSASDSPSGTIAVGGNVASSSSVRTDPEEPPVAGTRLAGLTQPPFRLPSSVVTNNQYGRAQFTARLDLDNDDVESTCWLSEPPIELEQQRCAQVLCRQASATVQGGGPLHDTAVFEPAPAATLSELPRNQSHIPVDITPVKGQRLVDLHEEPDTPTKIAEALIKKTDEEQTESWLNSGSPPEQWKNFQKNAVDSTSGGLKDSEISKAQGRKTDAVTDKPDSWVGHRKVPSDVPEHLIDLLLNSELPKLHVAPEAERTSSIVSASSAWETEPHKLNPVNMHGSVFGGASDATHSVYSLNSISNGGRAAYSDLVGSDKGIHSRQSISNLDNNHRRAPYREVNTATPSPSSTPSLCQESSVHTDAAAPDEEVSSAAAVHAKQSGSKPAPKKKTLIPRKGDAALFSQIPDTERRIEAGRRAMSAGSGGSTPQSSDKQYLLPRFPSISASCTNDTEGKRVQETTEARLGYSHSLQQPTLIEGDGLGNPSGEPSGCHVSTVYCFDSPSLQSPGPSPELGQHYPSYISPFQYGGLSSSPIPSPSTPANSSIAQPKRVAAAARPISHTLLGQTLSRRVALAIAPPGKDS